MLINDFCASSETGKEASHKPCVFPAAKQREKLFAGCWNVQLQMLTGLLSRVQNPAGCLFFQFWKPVNITGWTSWLLFRHWVCAGFVPQDLILEASELLCLGMDQMVPGVALLALLPSAPSRHWWVVGSFLHFPLFLFAFSRSWSWAICPVFLIFVFVLWGKKYLNPSVLYFYFFPFTVWDN